MAETAARPQPKPFYRRSEFWTSLVTSTAPWLIDALPATWKLAASLVVQGVYTISRGIAKHGTGD